jgi:hypothetical protein
VELYAPSLHDPAETLGPDPAPPSIGERLLPLLSPEIKSIGGDDCYSDKPCAALKPA